MAMYRVTLPNLVRSAGEKNLSWAEYVDNSADLNKYNIINDRLMMNREILFAHLPHLPGF